MRANQDIYSKQKSVLLYLLAIGAAFLLLAFSITTADAQTYSVALTPRTDTGTSHADGITADTTPTLEMRGFALTDTLNITATHATASTVTVVHTRNAPHINNSSYETLPELAEGEWSVVVQSQSSNPSRATVTITISSSEGKYLISNRYPTGDLDYGDSKDITRGSSASSPLSTSMPFTTGTDPYSLKSVRLVPRLKTGTGDLNLSLQGNNENDRPDGTTLASVTVAGTDIVSNSHLNIVFTTPVPLTPSSSYHLVFSSTNTLEFEVGHNSATTVVEGLTGWSFHNLVHDSGGGWVNGNSRIYQISLFGTETAYGIGLKASSDTGDSSTDGITNDNTPTITVSGYGDNAAVTITASKTGETSVTAQITGNGDKDLGTLADGEWTISATDGTNAAPDITITVDTNPPPAIAASVATLTGHVAGADTYINKADRDAAAQALIATPTAVAGATYTYAIIGHTDTCDGSTGTFSTTIPDTDTQTADGVYKLCITLADVAGNAVYRASSIFQIDTTVPTIGSYSGPSGDTAYGTAIITFTPNEAGKLRANAACGIPETSIGGSYVNDVFTVPLTLDPGTYASCSFVIEDVAGNPSTAQTIASFTILAPTYTIDLKVSSDSGTSNTDNITNDDTPTFTVSGLDNNATVTVTATHTDNTEESHTRTGNGDVTFPSNKSLKDGVWSVVASDGTNTTAALSVTIDTTAPPAIVSGATTLVGHAADGYVTKAEDDAAAGALVATPTAVAGATFRYIVVRTALDSNCANYPTGVWTSTTIPTTSSLGADAPYKICVRLRDVAGNAVFSETSAFKKDTVVPVISSVTAPTGTVITSTPTLTFTSSEAGETRANAACNIEAGITVTTGANTLTFPHLTNKAYSCSFVIQDTAGNPSAAETFSFTVDAASIVLKDGEDDGAITDDNTISEPYPTFVLAGFSGTVTINAVKGNITRTDTRSGDGETIFTDPFEDGTWTATATDTGSPVKTATLTFTVQEDLPTVALKNFGQSQHSDVRTTVTVSPGGGVTRQRAQSFTTGDIPYFVKQVQFEVVSTTVTTGSLTTTVEIRADNNGSPASTALASTAVSDSVLTTRGIKTATFTTAQKLDPNTTYHIVFDFALVGSSAKVISLRIRDPGQDAESISGWSVGSRPQQKTPLSDWNNLSGDADKRLSIGIYGYPAPHLELDTDTGVQDNVVRPISGQRSFTLYGFPHSLSASVTGTVTHNDDSAKTGSASIVATGMYDSTVYFPSTTLQDAGDWTATITDGGTRTAELVVTIDPDDPLLIVSNTGQTDHASSGGRNIYDATGGRQDGAQSFTTGADPYTLETVQFEVFTPAPDIAGTLTITVEGVDDSGNPDGSALATATLANDVLETKGLKTAEFSTPSKTKSRHHLHHCLCL